MGHFISELEHFTEEDKWGEDNKKYTFYFCMYNHYVNYIHGWLQYK